MRYSKYISPILLFGDLLILNLSFVFSYYLRFGSLAGVDQHPYLDLSIFINAAWIVLAIITNPYKISRISRFATIWRGHFTLVILHLLLVTAFFVFQKAYYYSRLQLFYQYATFTLLIFVWRASFVYLLRIYRRRGFNRRNVIILGYGDIAFELYKFFRLHPEHGFNFLGFFDNSNQGVKWLGKINDTKGYVLDNHVDEIYCCLPYVRYTQIKNIIDFADENLVKVKLIADFRGFSFKGLELQRYDQIPVFNVTAIPLDNTKNQIVKRTFDILFSSLVIASLLSWIVPIVALLIKLDSRGPIFFRQKRTGKDGEVFWLYKFRTMTVNHNADHLQATKNDPRITKLGSFLRKSSLDELPQFFNVFLGDMSVVGPRPHMLKHTEEYSKRIEKFMSRHFVKPGITGLAQTRGYRGETENLVLMRNRVKLDRFYIENWSLFLDLKIVALTIDTLLKGDDNAY